MNVRDSKLFYESFLNLLELAGSLQLDLKDSYLTLDSGLDNMETKNEMLYLRGLKNREKINKILDDF